MDSITTLLYTTSNALLFPVVGGLLVMLALAILHAGGAVAEARARRALAKRRDKAIRAARGAPRGTRCSIAESFLSSPELGGHLRRFAALAAATARDEAPLRQAVDEVEVEILGRLGRISLGARSGPMLGLMGTLIPLGPALMGLSSGDPGALASRLVVAFTTTVVGLLAGGIWHVMGTVRRRWYARDLSDIEFLAECLRS